MPAAARPNGVAGTDVTGSPTVPRLNTNIRLCWVSLVGNALATNLRRELPDLRAVAGNSASVLGTTRLPRLERTRKSSSEDAYSLCDLLTWDCTGPSRSESLSQDQSNGRKRRAKNCRLPEPRHDGLGWMPHQLGNPALVKTMVSFNIHVTMLATDDGWGEHNSVRWRAPSDNILENSGKTSQISVRQRLLEIRMFLQPNQFVMSFGTWQGNGIRPCASRRDETACFCGHERHWPVEFGQSIVGQFVFCVCCVHVLCFVCCVVLCVLPSTGLAGPPSAGCCVKPQRLWGPRGFTRQPKNSKRAHLRVQFKHHQNSTKGPQERETKRARMGQQEREKKSAKFWASHPLQHRL